ncbi:MAG TPA: cytochrome C [Epsilonproteobacteria bacterium]|nr:cytochrome C [Campylobacterota bacterium]
MKKLTTLALVTLLGLAMATTGSFADATKGQKLYSKFLKDGCGFGGSKFAATYTQDKWEEIKDAGTFADKVKEICPNVAESYQDKWSEDLYDFAYEFASDSGNIPGC